MEHLFFDATAYPWHLRPESERLYEALYRTIKLPAEIDRVYQTCAELLPPLQLNAAPPQIWKEALENLAARPGALRALCDQLTYPQLAAVVQEVKNFVPRRNQFVTKENLIILDRLKLREQLELVSSESAPLKVLLVRGEKQSGKSYSHRLMQAAALDRDAAYVYLTPPLMPSVKSVITRLFNALGALDRVPVVFTTDFAGYEIICNELQAVAMSVKKQLWVAADDVGRDDEGVPLVSKEVKEFFDQFGLFLTDTSFAAWFRLMLINYPKGKPTQWTKEVYDKDHTSEADVQQAHVEEAVRAWAAARGVNIVEQQLSGLAADVIARAEAPPEPSEEEDEEDEKPSRLQRINEELKKALEDLARQHAGQQK